MPPLHILHLEDDPADAALVEALLKSEGVACLITRAASRQEFLTGLDDNPDLILADFALPGFDGIAAQRLAGERRPDVPFVFVSGTMGEEVAIERLKDGATDYVLKHRLQRLPSAVHRALSEAEDRRRRTQAEAEVRRLNAQLERRVAERTEQLAAANRELVEREAELRESRAFLEHLISASPSMIFRFDSDLRATYVSPNIGWLLGYAAADVVGAPGFWESIIHPDDHDAVLEAIRHAREHTVVQLEQEYRCRAKDGRYRWFFTLLRIEYDEHGAEAGILGYALDIGDRKGAEEEARLAKLEAERANRAKSDFLSRMSHDLRTPLNAVIGFAQLLEMDPLTAPQAEAVRQILNGGRHLLDLINDVLDITRIEIGQLSLSPEPVHAALLVQEIVDLLAPLGRLRRVAVKADVDSSCPIHVRADQLRLKQVLLNLVGNAIKYNREGGEVRVSCATRPPDRAVIIVTDTGFGIPEQKLDLLFQPFERLGAEQTAIEGTGLGLAVSKALTQAMGGTIGVQSRLGSGTSFWIDLPESAAPGSERQAARGADAAGSLTAAAGTVLYIEDNPANTRLMQRVLARRPEVRLLTASSGETGVAEALRGRPDLIFLDLHLPDVPGEDVLGQLRGDASTTGIPVAVLSADATPSQARRLYASGAVAYLTKPIDLAQVLRLVDEHLAVKHKARAVTDDARPAGRGEAR